MKLLLSVVVAASTSLPLHAQTLADTVFLSAAKENIVKNYESFIAGQQLYYNGSAYVEPQRTNEQHSFFLGEDWVFGEIVFDGETFTKIPLLYDIMIDQLITESRNGNMQVLPREKVKRFLFDGHIFENINNSAVGNSLPRSGYYEVLYGGRTKVICLHQKFTQEKIESHLLDIYFEERNRYFVLKDGAYLPIKSQRSLLKILNDHRSELKTFVRKNNSTLKGNRDLLLPAIARQYDTITGAQK
jgi:hypothetical protein